MDLKKDEWFNLNEIKDGIWAINDKTGVNCYLIEGETRSLLIDTGWGLGNLNELVKSLTSLPVEVVFTHGHPDHVNGAFQFSNLHITQKDEKLLRMFYIKETREQIINRFKDIIIPGFSKDKWVNAKINDPTVIRENDVFDLGDRNISVIECPGHTPGSVCLLDRKNKILFSGDSILTKPVLMNLETSLKLNTYLESLKHIDSFSEDFNIILSGHDEQPVDTIVIDELIEGVSDIINGKIKGKLEKTRFGEALHYNFTHTAINYKEDNL
jgi:hydroxyacylglutathione hydrolase